MSKSDVYIGMVNETMPPGPADKACDAYAQALRTHESVRRPGESGLMRALALGWAVTTKGEKK